MCTVLGIVRSTYYKSFDKGKSESEKENEDLRTAIKRIYDDNKGIYGLENVLKRDFTTDSINEKWVGDITYIHTIKDGWCYLASALDLYSKKIIGYAFGKRMTNDLVTKALKNAYYSQAHDKDKKLIYVIQNNKDYLLVEVEGTKFFNIALTEDEGKELKEKLNQSGNILFKSWKEIFPYFVMTQWNALIYNFNNKDMVLVGEPYLGWLYDSPFQ